MQVMHCSGTLLVPFACVGKDRTQHGITRAENGGFICHGTYLSVSLCKCAYDMKKLLLLLFLFVPLIASANVIWPSIYILSQVYCWYVIVAGLVVEFFAVKFFGKTSWGRSAVITAVMNAVSALVGWVLIPVSGILTEFLLFPFEQATFHLSHWIVDYVFVALVNTCVEGLSMKLIFKYSFKRVFWWLFAANAVSVIISVLVPFSDFS